ncbi:hypothetical protein [Hwanghaeella sp.]|uniref:hypothetical protein n=1 Tax=Hwanghaeella sp. TaxID=2605943 RepID=UPI003CCBF9C8
MMRLARAFKIACLIAVAVHLWPAPTVAVSPANCLVLGRTVAVRDTINAVIFENVSAALADVGICVRDKQFPAKRVSEALIRGEIDGELMRIGAYRSVVGDAAIPVKEPLFYIVGYLVARDTTVASVNDVNRMSLATLRGIVWQRDIGALAAKNIVANTPEQQFEMLQAGRVDAILMDGVNFDRFPELKNMSRLEVSREPAFIYLHRAWKNLSDQIAAAVRSFKGRGCLFETPQGGKHCQAADGILIQ